ncbi:MAG: dethiobiotin synthase [Gammaproteobacteria bacterium]|nr:dethiobiotin synthase [Gammaproteobacteria bacterium]
MANNPSPHGAFITGTDTGVGKTLVTVAIGHALKQRGLSIAALKPIASGGIMTPHGLRNDDAVLLQQQLCPQLDYAQINPYCLALPVSPHLAARAAGITIDLQQLQQHCHQIIASHDFTLIEGVGGWRVPLTEAGDSIADLACMLNLPVILVVGLRLGCLNHALLTADAIERSGLPFAGWVANILTVDMGMLDANIATLQQMLPAPLLGTVPHLSQGRIDDDAALATYLDITALSDR